MVAAVIISEDILIDSAGSVHWLRVENHGKSFVYAVINFNSWMYIAQTQVTV